MTGRKKFNRFRVVKPTAEQQAQYLSVYRSLDLYQNAAQCEPLSSPATFGNDLPFMLDLGSGRGEFIVNQAQAQPDKNWVGIDFHWKSIYDSINKVSELALPNVKFVRADLRWILQVVPKAAVETVFLLFPAPVMQKRYLRKDVFTAAFVEQLHRILRSQGQFHFVTDSEAYFAKKQQLMAERKLFKLQSQQTTFEGGQTRYQHYWESLGVRSWRAEYVPRLDNELQVKEK